MRLLGVAAVVAGRWLGERPDPSGRKPFSQRANSAGSSTLAHQHRFHERREREIIERRLVAERRRRDRCRTIACRLANRHLERQIGGGACIVEGEDSGECGG